MPRLVAGPTPLFRSVKSPMFSRRRFHQIWRSLRSVELVLRAAPGLVAAHTALMVALGVMPVVSLYLLKLVIDTLTSAVPTESGWSAVVELLAAAALVSVLTDWLRALNVYLGDIQSQRVTDHVHDLLNRQSLRLDLSYYENPEFHDTYHRAQSEAPHRPALIVNHLVGVLQNSISLGGVVFLLVAIQWKLTIWVFVAMLPILAARLQSADFRHRSWRGQTSRLRQSHYLGLLINHQDHAKEVRLFELGVYLLERFLRLRESIGGDQRILARQRAIGEGFTQSCASLAVYGSLAFLVHQTVTRAIGIGELIVYYQALQRGQAILRDLFANAAGLLENALFLSNFYDFLLLEPRVDEPKAPRGMAYPLTSGVRFESVAFDYPRGARAVLRDVDLTIRPGETVAIVGRNGAGKTTLIKLLCRLYDPSRGRITIDGVDLRDVSGAEWRKQIAVVTQDFGRYQFTARENIGMGDIAALDDSERIEKAAAAAGAADTIENLSNGYETPLGTLFPGGQDLSVGQWQQIAIARAMLRAANILVLDEPTSALDPTAEAALSKQFMEMAKGRTAIMVSHRLSTVRIADRIVVIDDGVVKESGTHSQLMRLGGLYAAMFQAQAERYLAE